MSDASALPDLPPVGTRVLTDAEARAKRIFAVCRWAGVIAVIEMADGYDAAMKMVEEGPDQFLPDDADFERINETGLAAIAYIEGTTP